MARLETLIRSALPGAVGELAPYRAWTGLPGYDPNVRRALLGRRGSLSLVYVLPDAKTAPGVRPSRWRVAPFGPRYSASLTPALRALWKAYGTQLDRRIRVEPEGASGGTALLVSSDEAHRLVLLFVTLEPRDDRRFWPAREGRPADGHP
jgi:hypothetical protein